jgi:hypothetical protein
MICTFVATLILIGSMIIQFFFIGSTGWTLALAIGYHALVVAAGFYVDYLISARRKLGIPT